MPGVTVHKATPSDAPAIQKLLRETWLDTYGNYLSQKTLDEVYKNWQSIGFLTKQIENTEMYFSVAKDSAQVVGIATARLDDDIVLLFRLYVSPSAQRKGIGSLLLDDVTKHFKEAKKIRLSVEVLNQKGQAFYIKMGFKEVSRTKEQVVEEWIEEIVMEKISS